MSAPTVSPDTDVVADAYTGDAPATGRFGPGLAGWGLTVPDYGKRTARPTVPDDAEWRDPAVGWGVILPERDGLSTAQLATAADAPEPVQQLVAARHGKVLRFRAGTTFGDWTLRDYAGGGDRLTATSPVGMGPKDVPQYLLICASPADVPWQVQYYLNPVRYVGRLDLDLEGLGHYVHALLDGWSGSSASYADPLVWAVDHQSDDITTLMRETVAQPLYAAMAADSEMRPLFLDGVQSQAAGAALAAHLAQRKPAVVVTSSHGMTGPLDDVDLMRSRMGLLVDQEHQAVAPESLLADWEPDGAVWFAQACCSAGADSPTAYDGLFDESSLLGKVLTGVARAGPLTSPLPAALLGAAKPLRAFIGHVEPTFSWTLRFPPNRQVLTADLVTCLYTRLCSGQPVGKAMSAYYPAIGSLLQGYVTARKRYETLVGPQAKPELDMLVYSRVVAHDRASTVILGDPTAAVALP